MEETLAPALLALFGALVGSLVSPLLTASADFRNWRGQELMGVLRDAMAHVESQSHDHETLLSHRYDHFVVTSRGVPAPPSANWSDVTLRLQLLATTELLRKWNALHDARQTLQWEQQETIYTQEDYDNMDWTKWPEVKAWRDAIEATRVALREEADAQGGLRLNIRGVVKTEAPDADGHR